MLIPPLAALAVTWLVTGHSRANPCWRCSTQQNLVSLDITMMCWDSITWKLLESWYIFEKTKSVQRMVKVNAKHKHCPWPVCVWGVINEKQISSTTFIYSLCSADPHICMNHLQPVQGRPMRARCHGHECFMGSRKQSSSDPLEWERMIRGL